MPLLDLRTSSAIRNGSPRFARDYFDAPGGEEATADVASCEEALARFESDALSAELDKSASGARPALRVVDGADG